MGSQSMELLPLFLLCFWKAETTMASLLQLPEVGWVRAEVQQQVCPVLKTDWAATAFSKVSSITLEWKKNPSSDTNFSVLVKFSILLLPLMGNLTLEHKNQAFFRGTGLDSVA